MNPSTLTNLCLSLMLCIALSMPISAQQLFMIHEDVVRVDKMMQYEEASMTLQKYIGAHGDGLTYNAATTNDMHYLYIIPIENHGALDELDKKFAALGEKVGMEKLGALFNKLEQCLETHRDFVIRLDEDLSYYPSGDVMADGGGHARKWTYIYGHTDKLNQLTEVSKKWKELYAKHGIQKGYRVYHGGLGTEIGTMIIVDYGADIADIVTQEKMIQEKFGAEGQALWMESIAAVRKFDEKYGQMRPDLSVAPQESK